MFNEYDLSFPYSDMIEYVYTVRKISGGGKTLGDILENEKIGQGVFTNKGGGGGTVAVIGKIPWK